MDVGAPADDFRGMHRPDPESCGRARSTREVAHLVRRRDAARETCSCGNACGYLFSGVRWSYDIRSVSCVPVTQSKSPAATHSPHCALRPQCVGHLFASQLQRTADLCCTKVYARAGLERRPPAQKMGDLSRRARTPARLRIRTVHAMEVICRPRSAPVARTPINLFNSHRRR